MALVTSGNALALWQETVKQAENRCAVILGQNLESYLVSLLMEYSHKPEIVKQLFAAAFLEAQQMHNNHSLQKVGDQCLLFAGLFPHATEKRLVKINYFVDLGRSAYISISNTANDLFSSLAYQFVVLMDVLQSIRPHPDLLPLQAYEQWHELGSQRALKILQEYTKNHSLPR